MNIFIQTDAHNRILVRQSKVRFDDVPGATIARVENTSLGRRIAAQAAFMAAEQMDGHILLQLDEGTRLSIVTSLKRIDRDDKEARYGS